VDIKQQIREIIKDHIEDKQSLCQLGDDDSISTLQINSLIFMKIIIDLEDTYDLEFDFDKLDTNNFRTINNLYEYVIEKIENDLGQCNNDTY